MRLNYCFLVMLTIILPGCLPSLPAVPLVYEYPITAKQPGKLIDEIVVISDERMDKSSDEFISPSLPVTIKSVMSRELIATGCVDSYLTGGSYENRKPPIQIKVQLLESSVDVPGRAGHEAGMVIGSALTPLGFIMASKGDVEAIGKVKMLVHVHNEQSGADHEETWTGVKAITFPKLHMNSSQMYSKALGAALKDAMNHLAGSLARVGINP
jgi:hypothetical protein